MIDRVHLVRLSRDHRQAHQQHHHHDAHTGRTHTVQTSRARQCVTCCGGSAAQGPTPSWPVALIQRLRQCLLHARPMHASAPGSAWRRAAPSLQQGPCPALWRHGCRGSAARPNPPYNVRPTELPHGKKAHQVIFMPPRRCRLLPSTAGGFMQQQLLRRVVVVGRWRATMGTAGGLHA